MTQNLKSSAEKLGWHLNSEFIEDLQNEKKDLNLNTLTKISADVKIDNIDNFNWET